MRGQLEGSVHVASWQLQTAVLFNGWLQKLPWEKQAELTASPPSPVPFQAATVQSLWASQGPHGPSLGLRTTKLKWYSSRNPFVGEKAFPSSFLSLPYLL